MLEQLINEFQLSRVHLSNLGTMLMQACKILYNYDISTIVYKFLLDRTG